MPLTPTDVHNVTFSKPPISKRGYNEDEVDVFLDLVGAELARLIQENCDLRNQVEQLHARPIGSGYWPEVAPVAPSRMKQTSPGGDRDVQAAKVLGLAQQIADRLTGEAKAEADGMLSQTRTSCEQLLSDARAKAQGMVNEAGTRAQIMINDARTKAETLDRQAREKAATLDRDTARKHAEIISSISRLEEKVDGLRTYERGYRTRLKTYLESQLHKLDERRSVPVGTIYNQPSFVVSGFSSRAEPDPREIQWRPAV
jgi:DivIVA domain-containing protein